MVSNIINFIKNNISWIKDIFTLLFILIATIISILAYRRARATVLEPIRNEVIKKQSKILGELLSFLSKYGDDIENGVDYISLVTINTVLSLKELGFVFSNEGEISKNIKDHIEGWIPCGKSKILRDVEIVGIFSKDEEKDKQDMKRLRRERYENAKKGIIEIDKIYLTVEYRKFMKNWGEFTDNPFLPSNVKIVLEKICYEITTNLTVNLKNVLENFIKDYCNKYFIGEDVSKFSPIGVYNEFNHNRIHHRLNVIILKNEIRKYLRIDEKW